MAINRRILSIVLLAGTVLVGPRAAAPVSAEPVRLVSVPVEFGIYQLDFPESLLFYVTYEETGPLGPIPGPRVLDTVLTPGAIPQTVTATAQSDPDFGEFVGLMTNGHPERIRFTYEPPTTLFGKSFAFSPLDANVMFVDWDAYRVTSLSYRLFEYSFDLTRPFHIQHVGILYPVVTRGVFEVHAEPVPEPSSLALVLIGAAGIARRRWRSRSEAASR